jgi:hypothetical protein
MSSAGVLFGRNCSLLIANANEAIDASELRITFRTTATDLAVPNTATIRVYNLSRSRVKELVGDPVPFANALPSRIRSQWEFSRCQLSAGYGDNLGLVFSGTIKQFQRGRDSNVDSFLELRCADSDLMYNFGTIAVSIPAGATPQQQLDLYAKAAGLTLAPDAHQQLTSGGTGGIAPQQLTRGKVAFGMLRDALTELAETNGARWSIQNGLLTIIPDSGYLNGTIVKVNSTSGMIGIPEASEAGVEVTTLLNPAFRLGGLIQLDESSVTATQVVEQFYPGYSSIPQQFADVTTDGTYRILQITHEGDTRGQSWYTKLVCLAVDPSAAPNAAVAVG